MENMPPLPGVLLSGVEKIALTFWKAIGTFSMTAKNWRLASSENPSTSFVTLRRSSGSGEGVLAVTAVPHQRARTLVNLRHRPEHLGALVGVRHVVGDGCSQNVSKS